MDSVPLHPERPVDGLTATRGIQTMPSYSRPQDGRPSSVVSIGHLHTVQQNQTRPSNHISSCSAETLARGPPLEHNVTLTSAPTNGEQQINLPSSRRLTSHATIQYINLRRKALLCTPRPCPALPICTLVDTPSITHALIDRRKGPVNRRLRHAIDDRPEHRPPAQPSWTPHISRVSTPHKREPQPIFLQVPCQQTTPLT
ncbi:hypothetical protein BDP55DRAFT_339441 [Colletotrichum godetiae]|uniref:Uncharacterized protein n=1 Tax=Colletotrichum godetiae TaxID=1209918 RepID=A0AAJ0AUN4_9PEZI|nr:uncharacterized protein BDP55DRAFT_339441 [Colletotrichum godetiae]KAK1690113.1 hypothetical protein BDP55DRAFT_339441 [Colletotrichum godetiae]